MIGNNVIKLQMVDSTNLSADTLSKRERLLEGTVIIAENQYSGRGQMGTKWESEPGNNIAISIVLYPEFLNASTIFSLNETIALGVVGFLNETIKNSFKIKWPNDILLNNKKVCGMLIENSLRGSNITQSIIGIGINVNQTEFQKYVPEAVSMKMITDKTYNISDCIENICSKVDYFYQLLKDGQAELIHRLYLENLFHYNDLRFFNIDGKLVRATITDVQKDGKLVVKTRDEQVRLFDTKEIKFVYD